MSVCVRADLTLADVMTGLRNTMTFCWSVCFQSVCVSLLNAEEVNIRLAADESSSRTCTVPFNNLIKLSGSNLTRIISDVFSGRAC